MGEGHLEIESVGKNIKEKKVNITVLYSKDESIKLLVSQFIWVKTWLISIMHCLMTSSGPLALFPQIPSVIPNEVNSKSWRNVWFISTFTQVYLYQYLIFGVRQLFQPTQQVLFPWGKQMRDHIWMPSYLRPAHCSIIFPLHHKLDIPQSGRPSCAHCICMLLCQTLTHSRLGTDGGWNIWNYRVNTVNGMIQKSIKLIVL